MTTTEIGPFTVEHENGEIPPKLLPRTVLDLRVELIVANEDIDRLRMAAMAHSSDLCEAGRLCAQSDDEYPLAAVQRSVAELAASQVEVERLRAQLNEAHFKSRIASATHRCKVCDARWIKFEGNWSMASKQCGKCCDVVAMGDQIEPIGLTAEIAERVALTDRLSTLLNEIANAIKGQLVAGGWHSWSGLPQLARGMKDQLDAATTGRASAAEGYRDVISATSKERDLCRSALELIASPVRPDGTYNRSREACEKLAREALNGANK